MCGIVGYLGPKSPKEVLLQGLRALEYRGYDSAGLAILNHGTFETVRAQGKLTNLELKVKNSTFDGHVGIGHTRWATHGPPSERNAHPHFVGGVSLVHNGIIENYLELREELLERGHQVKSETDSELVAHFLSEKIHQGMTLKEAVFATLPRLRGAYAIVCVSDKDPEQVLAFKNGPPLLVGVGKDECIVASDVQAVLPYTNNILYMEDGEVMVVSRGKVEIFDQFKNPIDRPITKVTWTPEQSEKSGFAHYMLKEIFQQPRSVAQAMEPHVDIASQSVKMAIQSATIAPEFWGSIERLFVVACGTSHFAGQAAKYWLERLVRLPTEVDIASEFRYRHPVFPKGSALLVISQSGETADTLAALRLAKEAGVPTLAICNALGSSIAREADALIPMNAGLEVGVASTKAFSSTLVVLALFVMDLAKAKGTLPRAAEVRAIESLFAAPALMEKVLAYDYFFKEMAEHLKNFKGFLYMGRGVNYPLALEGALKMKELAYMHAEGYAAGEMKHGPLALIDPRIVIIMLAPNDDLFEKTLSNLEEAKARGGKILTIGTGESERLKKVSDYYLSLPEGDLFTNVLFEVIPLQLMAYHVAVSLGNDVDQPRNLAKSVTVE